MPGFRENTGWGRRAALASLLVLGGAELSGCGKDNGGGISLPQIAIKYCSKPNIGANAFKAKAGQDITLLGLGEVKEAVSTAPAQVLARIKNLSVNESHLATDYAGNIRYDNHLDNDLQRLPTDMTLQLSQLCLKEVNGSFEPTPADAPLHF